MNDSTRVALSRSLVATAAILYVPSNVLPVMTMTLVGKTSALTVLGGARELWDSGLPLVAGVVFLASFLVPLMKILSMGWILSLHGTRECRHRRNSLHVFLHRIGSWSMIDIFLLAVLAAVGQLGMLAEVHAEPGALIFTMVTVCLLLATEIYKPRLIWEA